MLRVAIISFVSLLLLAEFVLWLRNIVLPFPLALGAGAGLAIAANWQFFRKL